MQELKNYLKQHKGGKMDKHNILSIRALQNSPFLYVFENQFVILSAKL